MTTPIHMGWNIALYGAAIALFSVSFSAIDLLFLLSAELIDLDHLTAKPIYDPKRNGFAHHFFHRNWKLVGFFAVLLLFFEHWRFLGMGILSHFALDWINVKFYIKQK